MKKNVRRAALELSLCMILLWLPACNPSPNITESGSKGEISLKKITDRDVVLHLMTREHISQPFKTDSPVIREVYKKTGIKLEVEAVPLSSFSDKKSVLVATNSLPDIVQVNLSELYDYGETGVFLPLLDRVKRLAPNYKKVMESRPEIDKTFINGEMYAFPVIAKNTMDFGRVPMIRADILKKLNLPMPDSFEELFVVLKAFKKAYPNADVWTNRNKTNNLMACVSYALGSGWDLISTVYYDKDVEGGKYTYGPASPRFREVLGYLNRLYIEGILDPNYATNTSQQWQENLSTGKSLFYFDNPTFAVNFNASLSEIDPGAGFKPIPTLKNSFGQRRNLFYFRDWWDEYNYAINAKVNEPDTAVKFFDWLYSEEGAAVTNFGVLGEHYTVEDGTYKIKQSVLDQYKNNSDPYRSMQSDLGTGLLSFSTYIDITPQLVSVDPELTNWCKSFARDNSMVFSNFNPPFSKNELERINALRNELGAYFDKKLDKLIMGVLPLSSYDEVIKTLKEKGAGELEMIYNNADARYKRSKEK